MQCNKIFLMVKSVELESRNVNLVSHKFISFYTDKLKPIAICGELHFWLSLFVSEMNIYCKKNYIR